MQSSINRPAPGLADSATPSLTGAPRLRTVTGNRFPRKCACGCGQPIPRDPEVRYVVDFGASRPYPAYLREHSPDFGSPFNRRPARKAAADVPGFVPASAVGAPAHELETPDAPGHSTPALDPAHADSDASPSPQAGRPWASGQLVFNAGEFESARSGFADYAREAETAAQLRSRVNRVTLEDLEQKVLALRALHEKLRDRLEGQSFGDVVARGRPV
jgi:hypothetical protein